LIVEDGGRRYPTVDGYRKPITNGGGQIITGGGGCFPINRTPGESGGGPCSLVVML